MYDQRVIGLPLVEPNLSRREVASKTGSRVAVRGAALLRRATAAPRPSCRRRVKNYPLSPTVVKAMVASQIASGIIHQLTEAGPRWWPPHAGPVKKAAGGRADIRGRLTENGRST